MYSGLCLELRITGAVRLKSVNQFEAFTQALKNVKSPEPEADPRDLMRREPSLSILGVPPPPPVRRDIPTLLTSSAYTQHHELLHENSCLVEIEPVPLEEPKFIKKCIENGLCLELRITGGVRLKSVNQFEAFTQALKNVKSPEPEADPRDLMRREPSLSILGVPPPPPVRRDIPTLLTSSAYTQHHELLHENSCLVEIEPVPLEEPKFIKKCIEKAQIVTEMLKTLGKKQGNASDDEDDNGLEVDDSDSDDDGARRSSHSDTQTSTTYDGDDGEVDALTREAQEQVMKDQPLSAAAVNAELCRRLGNVVEKNKMNREYTFSFVYLPMGNLVGTFRHL
ncbi:hypothetical protein AHF37_11272 [Paragonimus kellicotti]|nr:hypothetical protein AHF37_11272 [Paragonimus kellicotti]